MAIKVNRKSKDPEEISLASTSDIAFLLIIFFLAASALLELKGVKLPLPKKDAPPLQIEKKNLFKIEIDKDQNFIHEAKKYTLKEILPIMEKSFKNNSELVFSIKVDPDCPSEIIPQLIYQMQRKNLIRFSITIQKSLK
ncbi:MAG: ExbD/TolR family protein [Leptonema sp. (in: bacteria)]